MIDARQTDDGAALLFMSGEVDLSHVEALWDTAMCALESGPARLLVDVSAVTFLDSSILGALLRIQRTVQDRGNGFALRHPSPPVQRLLRLTGLDSVIHVEA